MTRGRAGLALTSLALATSLLTACSDESTPEAAPSAAPTESTAPPASARRLLLTPEDVPGLTGRTSVLTADDLAEEADNDEVLAELSSDGYVAGLVRDLRGPSRVITGADSRVLVFGDSQGAVDFSASIADSPDPFFGGPSVVRPLSVGGTKGFLIKPPLCDCPGAFPVYVGLVAEGSHVLWLQATGPRATAERVRRLLTRVLERSD